MEERRIAVDCKVQELAIKIARLEEKLAAAAEALILADKILDHYKMVSNEWRQENIDQRSQYMTIDKTNSLVQVESSQRYALDARVRVLEDAEKVIAGKEKAFNTTWAVIAFIVMAGIAVVALILRPGVHL